MFPKFLTCGLLLSLPSIASAGAIDYSHQSVNFMYEDKDFAEFQIRYLDPDVSGRYIASGTEIKEVLNDYTFSSLAFKKSISPHWSIGILKDEPYGADLLYPNTGLLAGVSARLETDTLTLLSTYSVNENFKLLAGVKYQKVNGSVRLPFASYSLEIPETEEVGYLVGGAYSLPEIGLHLSVDYHPEVTHKITRNEVGGSVLCLTPVSLDSESTLPEALNINLKTGLTNNLLLFAGARIARYDEFKVNSHCLQMSLTNYDRTEDYRVGLAYKFSDSLAASIHYTWQEGMAVTPTSSPLTPTNGKKMIGLGLRYSVESIEVSAGVTKILFNDDSVGISTANLHVADFENNDAWLGGLKLRLYF